MSVISNGIHTTIMLPLIAVVNKRDCLYKRLCKTSQFARANIPIPRDSERRASTFGVSRKRENRSRTFFGIRLAGTPRGNGETGFIKECDDIVRIAAGKRKIEDMRRLRGATLLYMYVQNSRKSRLKKRSVLFCGDAKRFAAKPGGGERGRETLCELRRFASGA